MRGGCVEGKSKARWECFFAPSHRSRAPVFSPTRSRFLFHCCLLIGASAEERGSAFITLPPNT